MMEENEGEPEERGKGEEKTELRMNDRVEKRKKMR